MNELKGKSFLVTGGAGFVGSTIAMQLVDAGAGEIRILDNFVRGSWANLAEINGRPEVKVIEGDIRDVETVNRATAGVDYVFHQAALRITRCADAPREAVDVLMVGTLNVLEACREFKVKRLVAASSASVYGDPSYLPMDEGHPFNNRTLYGAGKVANEQMFRSYFAMFGLPYVAFRYFNVYGPRMDITGAYTEVLIRWMEAIEAGKPPLIFGDGKQSMDFIYVDDVARANILAMQSDVTDEVFNVGTGVETNLIQLCDTLIELMGSKVRPEFRESRKLVEVRSRRATTEKAEKMLGFRAKVDLASGLRELIRWRAAMNTAAAAAK